MSDGNSPDTENKPTMTRRHLIQTALTLGAAAALRLPLVPQNPEPQPEKPTATTHLQPSIPERPELEPLKTIDRLKNFVFKKHQQNDLSKIYQSVEAEAKKHLKNDQYFPPYAQKIRNYSDLISSAAKTIQKAGIKVEPEWLDIIKGLILAESSGDPDKVTPDPDDPTNPAKFDRGLCQIRKPAETMARNRLHWGETDIMKPGDNITIGLCYLMILQEKYQDPLLALSAYNQGENNIDGYLRNKSNLPINNPGIEYTTNVLGSTKAVLEG